MGLTMSPIFICFGLLIFGNKSTWSRTPRLCPPLDGFQRPQSPCGPGPETEDGGHNEKGAWDPGVCQPVRSLFSLESDGGSLLWGLGPRHPRPGVVWTVHPL